MEPRIQYARTSDGVSIAFAVIGSGAPVVYIGAGGFGDLHLHTSLEGLADVIDAMALGGRAVVLHDNRGSGASDRTPLADSLDARLLDLEAVVVGTLGLSTFDILGHGHGAALAITYAVRHPGQIGRLVLSNGYSRGADYYAATPYTRGIRFLSGIAADDWQFFCLTVGHWVTAFRNSDAAHRVAAAMQSGMSPDAYFKHVETSEAIDVTDLLPQVTVPTLVLRDHSQAYTDAPEVSKPLAARIPAARLVTVSSLEARAAAILQFLEEGHSEPLGAGRTARSEVVTVLFTDVEGSTALTDRLGDAAAREVLREHERVTREALKAHGGSEIKTMGDGFMASFGSATKALECAIAIQKAFADGDIRVRIGLNAGEPIAEDEDLFGTAVIVAARIAAQAHGGEILVSDVVRQLVAGKGFLFNDRGEHALKGFEDLVHVFEVQWVG